MAKVVIVFSVVDVKEANGLMCGVCGKLHKVVYSMPCVPKPPQPTPKHALCHSCLEVTIE